MSPATDPAAGVDCRIGDAREYRGYDHRYRWSWSVGHRRYRGPADRRISLLFAGRACVITERSEVVRRRRWVATSGSNRDSFQRTTGQSQEYRPCSLRGTSTPALSESLSFPAIDRFPSIPLTLFDNALTRGYIAGSRHVPVQIDTRPGAFLRAAYPAPCGTTLPEHSLARGNGKLRARILHANHNTSDVDSQPHTCWAAH